MSVAPRYNLEDPYDEISTDQRAVTPDPETDINVKRGLTWAIGGVVTGAILAIVWFVYRLFAPAPGVDVPAWDIADVIVMPILALLYGAIGAVVGGCLGMGIGISYMGLAALKESREAEDEEIEEEPIPRVRNRRMRESF